MKTIQLSDNLELAFNESMTEVSINRTDNPSCFIDIVVIEGKLYLDYCDHDQWDRNKLNPLGMKRLIHAWYEAHGYDKTGKGEEELV